MKRVGAIKTVTCERESTRWKQRNICSSIISILILSNVTDPINMKLFQPPLISVNEGRSIQVIISFIITSHSQSILVIIRFPTYRLSIISIVSLKWPWSNCQWLKCWQVYFITHFIELLLNTTTWQTQNEASSNWIDRREGRSMNWNQRIEWNQW